eukprot:CAMPEP_0171979208 /NCGR_PEP_ID=MMETSP0993-20121228/255832_1 /TAXON_ID=483369 /ORGANISM="non described non described, Strain CCMP2098" /LENGTH=83 /DNA_ID=CAMNT_0012631273 /DNA_START=75 /DNA_END=323 /DNA_ORIENTATION=+
MDEGETKKLGNALDDPGSDLHLPEARLTFLFVRPQEQICPRRPILSPEVAQPHSSVAEGICPHKARGRDGLLRHESDMEASDS